MWGEPSGIFAGTASPVLQGSIDILLFRIYDLGAISVVAAATAIWWIAYYKTGFPS